VIIGVPFCFSAIWTARLSGPIRIKPTLQKKADKYEATYSHGHNRLRTAHNDIETHTEIVVSPRTT